MDKRTQRKLTELNKLIGETKDDMIITNVKIVENKGRKEYKVNLKCAICNREKEIHEKYLYKGSATKHKSCMYLVPRDDHFHNKYKGMIKRMNNPNYESYARYGGRGLTCEYENYIDFYDDFYKEYLEHCEIHGADETTIERIDFNKGYVKDNITFATPKEQANNRSDNWENVQAKFGEKGDWFSVSNVRDFCKEKNLFNVSVYKCLAKIQKQCKGWYFKGNKVEK